MKKIWLALLLSMGLSVCVFVALSTKENEFQMDADGYMQEVFSNRVLEAGEIFRRNLVLAADEYRSGLILESGRTRVFSYDSPIPRRTIFLFIGSGLAAVAAGILIANKRKSDE